MKNFSPAIQEMLKHNAEFVQNRGYERYITTKYPDKKVAIVTCMDTRLVELLPAALGLRNGDVKMIKNAGGMITDPYGACMRSLLVAVYELGVTDIMCIGHTTCGVLGMDPDEMFHHMEARGVERHTIDAVVRYSGHDIRRWLTGFEDTHDAVRETVALVKDHPLMPHDINVYGFVLDTVTGALESVD